MARKGKRDPRIASEWPVTEFPYVVGKPGALPDYHRDHKAALNKELAAWSKMRNQFKDIDSEFTAEIDEVTEKLRAMGSDGGTINRKVGPVWYRFELRKREDL